MAENLNFAGNEVGESFCYNKDDELCEMYGRLYSREAAMNSADCGSDDSCSLGSAPIQGVCPEGWHIPSEAETDSLIAFLGSKMDSWAASKGWAIDKSNGDNYGMSFIPSGLDGIGGFAHIDLISITL